MFQSKYYSSFMVIRDSCVRFGCHSQAYTWSRTQKCEKASLTEWAIIFQSKFRTLLKHVFGSALNIYIADSFESSHTRTRTASAILDKLDGLNMMVGAFVSWLLWEQVSSSRVQWRGHTHIGLSVRTRLRVSFLIMGRFLLRETIIFLHYFKPSIQMVSLFRGTSTHNLCLHE